MRKTIFYLAISFAFASCSDDGNIVEKIPSSTDFQNLFDPVATGMLQTATFSSSNPNYVFTSTDGTKLTIDGTCLRKNGNPVTGTVDLEFTELNKKEEWLLANKPTMGKNTNGDIEPLKSGGSYNVVVKQNGVALTTTCFYKLEIPTANTGGTDASMLPFTETTSNGNTVWEQSTTVDFWISQQGTNPAYNVLSNMFSWFNCDRFYNDPGPKTELTIQVPQGYGGNNSVVFITMDTFPNSLGKTYGKFPIGKTVHFIFLTEKDGLYRYAMKPATLEANHTVQFSLSETKTGTLTQFKAAIAALP